MEKKVNLIIPWSFSPGIKKMFLYMKLTIAIFLAAVLQTIAGVSYAQNTTLSLNLKNVSVQTVLQQIEDQSEFYFLYSRSVVDVDRNVNIQVKDVKIKDVLDVLFTNSDVAYKIDGRQIVLSKKPERTVNESQQQKTVSGKVTDSSGAPLPGASVVVKGTTNGIITDANGNYSLSKVQDNAILVFSFVGMRTQEVTAEGKTILNVSLQDETVGIEEVVAIGYGTQKKVNLTGAVSQITADSFEDRPVSELTKALQGAIPNLNITFGSGKPGQSGALNIRGNTSINGGSPLVLIDGIPGEMDRININDVESISVLKDASASAIYGARAAFGVILITTKTAKKGKMQIQYSGNYGIATHSTNTDFITSGYENARINDETMFMALGSTTTRYTEEMMNELYLRRNDKTENPDRPWVVIEKDASGKDIYRYYGNFDWFNYFYDRYRPRQDQSLSLSGASDNTRYMLSGSYYKEQGIFNINPDNFNKFTLRSRTETDVNKWLKFNTTLQYFKSNYEWVGDVEPFNQVTNNLNNDPCYQYLPAFVPRNPDGTLTHMTGLSPYQIGYGIHNILEEGKSKGNQKYNQFRGTFELVATPMKGLTLTGNYTYDYNESNWQHRAAKHYYSKYPGVLELGTVYRLKNDIFQQSWYHENYNIINLFGNYKKSLGMHNLSLTAGFNQEWKKYERLKGVGWDLLSTTLNDMDLVTGDEDLQGGAYEWALRGLFYRGEYDYKGKYLLEVSGRYDGSSRFPKNSRFGFFPSFSVGWRVSEEPFFAPVKAVLNNLKVRYSYGELGNQNVDTYAYISSMPTSTISYLIDGMKLNATGVPNTVANTLTWERAVTNNIGLDFDLWNSHLSFSGDYYIRDTKDMLTTGTVLPKVFGATEPKENAADLRTKGFEIALSWRNQFDLGGKPFKYSITAVLSDYTAKITKFDNPSKILTSYYEGQKLGDIWGYSYDGFFKTNEEAQEWAAKVDQDKVQKRRVQAPTAELKKLQAGDIKILDRDNNGIISYGANTLNDPGDRRIVGNSQTRFPYGLTLSSSWNGFDMSVVFQGIGKRNWYPDRDAQMFWHTYARPYDSFLPANYEKMMWSPENPNSYFPLRRGYIAQNAELYEANDMYIQDLAYCKLRNLTIGYSLPKKLLDKIGFNKIRIYLSGENLHTWSKLDTDYIDPEQVMSDPTGRVYQLGRVYSVGAQINF